MRALSGILVLFLLVLAAAPGLADDRLTIAYTSNSFGEYIPCPT